MNMTRYRGTLACRAGLLLMLCAMHAGCGNQAAQGAGMAPGAHAVAYTLSPLALGAASTGSAGAPQAAEGAAQPGRRAIPADDVAPGAQAQAPVVRGINQTEQIIGSYRLASGERRAFLWTASHGMRDLNDLVKDKPSDLTLSDALAISDAGAIVVKGDAGMFLLRPLSKAAAAGALPSGD